MLQTRQNWRAVKFGWRHRKRPTPKRMKRLGDALFATFGTTGLSIGVPQMFMQHQSKAYVVVAVVSIALGMLGKFLSTFFGDDEPKSSVVKNEEVDII